MITCFMYASVGWIHICSSAGTLCQVPSRQRCSSEPWVVSAALGRLSKVCIVESYWGIRGRRFRDIVSGLSWYIGVSLGRKDGNEASVSFLFFLTLTWLQWVSVVAYGIFSCCTWDLVPWPRIEPGRPALGAQSISRWTTREILSFFLKGKWIECGEEGSCVCISSPHQRCPAL